MTLRKPASAAGIRRALTVFGSLLLLAAAAAPVAAGEGGRTECVGLLCLDVVAVGDPGNPPDPETGLGAVATPFDIGRYEITAAQYATFLNAVAATPAEHPEAERAALEDLWQEDMQHPHHYVSPGVIARTGQGTAAAPYVYSVMPDPALGDRSGQRGMPYISWFAAARLANWLNNGATAQSSTETGAYTLEGRRDGVVPRNPGARWWIPSASEWYKAAYYDPSRTGPRPYWNYPTRSDLLPLASTASATGNGANYDSRAPEAGKLTPVGAHLGSTSHYGTYDQAGLLWEWVDTTIANHDGVPETVGLWGGSWSLGLINLSRFGGRDYLPAYSDDDTGIRLATTGETK